MSRPAGRAALAFIFVSIVLDIVAFGIVIPVLPKLIESFVNYDSATAARWVGLFGTIWAFMQFICAPMLGALSDRYGRRPVLLLSIAGLGFDYIFMALAPTLGWLLVGRIVSGMTASGFATASAYIADVTEPENRAAAFGLVGAAWGFGFIVGPALGGMLGASDPRLPFWVAGALALVNAMYGFFILPESLPPEKRAAFSWARANPLGSLQFLRAHRELLPLAGVSFLYNLGHTVYPSVFVLWAGYVLKWGAKEVGFALAIVGIANVVVQGGVVRPMVKRLGARTALAIGATAGTVGFTLYGLTDAVWLIWIAIFVYAPAGVFNPSLMGVMSKRVGASGQGRLQGATSSLMGIAGMAGPPLFTLSYAAMIRPGARWHLPGLPFFIAAGLFAAAGLVAMRVTREAEA